MENKPEIKKITGKDLLEVAEFAALNSYSEYDFLKPDKKEMYASLLKKFVNDKTKSAYSLKDKNKEILGVLLFEESFFDTKFFGVKTFKLSDIIISRALERNEIIDKAHLLLDFFMEEMKKKKARFVQCKLDSRNVYLAQVVEELGFRLASVDVTLFRNLAELREKERKDEKHAYQITCCTAEDVECLYLMSKEIYTTTRFHNDPDILREKADEMQALWIKNCYHEKLADEIILVKEGRTVCGYVACGIVKNINFADNKKIGRIILIAVDKKFQNKGIGSIIINEGAKWFRKQGCDLVAVGTQLINWPALKFYQKNWFRLESAALSFHRWL